MIPCAFPTIRAHHDASCCVLFGFVFLFKHDSMTGVIVGYQNRRTLRFRPVES